ncbi:MAG TPA: energy transducer TonB [Bacteroidia bacterium]|jgi:protein TonB|nr:energy transducer TonB [Bacteroidia bacterium]
MAEGKTSGGWNDVTSYGRNEIVFEGRNKAYGAYFVRRRYKDILLLAFGVAVGVMALGISLPVILRLIEANKGTKTVEKKIDVNLTPPPPITPPKVPPPPPPPPPPPKQLVKELKVTPPEVVKHVVDSIPPPTVHQTMATNVGDENKKGKDTLLAPQATNTAIGDDANKVFLVVQQMPAFPGDVNKYLADHINYPEVEKEAQITGTVYINFVVEKDGSISNVKVLKGVPGGPGLDKEAVKVISAMPKWSVGMQNGHPVRVSYNIPIRFVLN